MLPPVSGLIHVPKQLSVPIPLTAVIIHPRVSLSSTILAALVRLCLVQYSETGRSEGYDCDTRKETETSSYNVILWKFGEDLKMP